MSIIDYNYDADNEDLYDVYDDDYDDYYDDIDLYDDYNEIYDYEIYNYNDSIEYDIYIQGNIKKNYKIQKFLFPDPEGIYFDEEDIYSDCYNPNLCRNVYVDLASGVFG